MNHRKSWNAKFSKIVENLLSIRGKLESGCLIGKVQNFVQVGTKDEVVIFLRANDNALNSSSRFQN